MGLDVLSQGGPKNEMMYGESVVFFNRRFLPMARRCQADGALTIFATLWLEIQ